MREMVRLLWNEPAAARKFVVALLAAVGVAISVGLLPAAVAGWVAVATAFLGALGVYGLHNAPVRSKKNEHQNRPR